MNGDASSGQRKSATKKEDGIADANHITPHLANLQAEFGARVDLVCEKMIGGATPKRRSSVAEKGTDAANTNDVTTPGVNLQAEFGAGEVSLTNPKTRLHYLVEGTATFRSCERPARTERHR